MSPLSLPCPCVGAFKLTHKPRLTFYIYQRFSLLLGQTGAVSVQITHHHPPATSKPDAIAVNALSPERESRRTPGALNKIIVFYFHPPVG
jgi:hypothetical protein